MDEPETIELETRVAEPLVGSRRLMTDANRARNRGRDRQAIHLYRRILIDNPRNVEVAIRAAPLLAYRGESFEAWQLFRTAARELLAARRLEACLGVLRDACRCVPHEFDAWRLRAELELKLGREQAAHETLVEGRQHFGQPQCRAQAIALLVRARAIEPWDPEVALDLARLYARSGDVEVALELLGSLAQRLRGKELRKVRGLQWRITLSFHHAWQWLRAWGRPAAADDADAPAASAPLEVELPTAQRRDEPVSFGPEFTL